MIDSSKTFLLEEMCLAKKRFGANTGRSLDEKAIPSALYFLAGTASPVTMLLSPPQSNHVSKCLAHLHQAAMCVPIFFIRLPPESTSLNLSRSYINS